jgi:hypothetical protein
VHDDGRLKVLLAQAGLSGPRSVRQLQGGGNNRVFVVETDARPVVLKEYFHHPDDPRDRLGAEFGFSQFAWAIGVRTIPRPLAADRDEHLGVYDYVDGVQPHSVDVAAVDQALAFVAQLNGQRQRGRDLPNAAEACFSLDEHLERVAARVAALECVQDEQARQLVNDVLGPAWESVRAAVAGIAASMGISLSRPLAGADRCISPSDFGFHNALLDARGQYWFLDFEYAGWDDPAKLVCDFFCQPERPVPLRFFDAVVADIARACSDPAWHERRIRLLWPAHQVKWACILLNEFLPVSRLRRQFAGADPRHARHQRLERSRDLLVRALNDGSRLQDVRTCSF